MRRTLVRPGCTLVYDLERREKAAANVVLLHGYGVDRRMWGPQLEALEDCTILNLDVRGHGESRPCDSFSIPAAADDLKAVLDAEKLERPVLAGLSMGGYVVQEYAWRYGGAAGYVLIGNTPLLLDCYAGWERWALKRSVPMFKPFPWGLLKGWMSAASACTPEGRRRVRAMFDELSRAEFLRGWGGVAVCLHPEPEFRFDAPLLVCRGERDRIGSIAKYMDRWEPAYGAQVYTVPDASHVANLDAPEEVSALLRRFIFCCKENVT